MIRGKIKEKINKMVKNKTNNNEKNDDQIKNKK
jgi:hypothetical protein